MAPLIFLGKTAWFSSSVHQSIKKIWEENGGTYADSDNADFIFSENIHEEDTTRLFSSDAYLREHLAIFHAQYITEVVAASDSSSVVLGNFYLPPPEVLRKLKMLKIPQSSQQLVSREEEFQKTTARKRKYPKDTDSPRHGKENTSLYNRGHSELQADTRAKIKKGARKPGGNWQSLADPFHAEDARQPLEADWSVSQSKKQSASRTTASSSHNRGLADQQNQPSPISTDDSRLQLKVTHNRGKMAGKSMVRQSVDVPTSSKGIQTLEDTPSPGTGDLLHAERMEFLQTQSMASQTNCKDTLLDLREKRRNRQLERNSAAHYWSSDAYISETIHGACKPTVEKPGESLQLPLMYKSNINEDAVLIGSLPQVEGDIQEFVPGQNGYCIML